MSMLARRAALRAIPRARGYANTTAELAKTQWAEKQVALKTHAAETANLWRRISLFVCIPAIGVCGLWVRNVEAEHSAHQKHLQAEHGGHLPEPPAYEYLNRRASGGFPWGQNTLFFNPRVNKDMSQQ
ncbi:mitochondrial cytochrome c oxidase subunit VIa [Laetiporus sulphureus 93-53]|uniref:Mitochondrial cytochrome c oxidase subunit VIa n=1 Tax=Laetiporus sulphureus 93-53 TaxID=1314785 RepID=A0A165DYA9_9APHY|nr:mitochondrial cytochrome c oxidase subunit VIa [Laetiporus sulphureus 93-53]KZT05867.1 mitochondrial cytochrome c oxidase subunit VIa [Laetiporus sulphureus 93-53]